MTRDSGTRTGKKSKKRTPSSIPVEQVSPAVLTASRDVAFTLQQLSLELDGEEVLIRPRARLVLGVSSKEAEPDFWLYHITVREEEAEGDSAGGER